MVQSDYFKLNSIIMITALVFGLTACGIFDSGSDDGPLTAELNISTGHIHTLSEITYTVLVKNQHGVIVTDMETVEVQRKAHGETDWSGTELTLSGEIYTGTYTFNSSGEYDVRVAGIRHGGSEMEVMHEMDDHMHVGRTHEVVGNYRIEYEHFPGHVHEGENATVKFWVYDNEEDADGNRPPATGLLDVHIHCSNPDGTTEHHTEVTVESEGVYVDEHTFSGAGKARMGIHFTAPDNSEIEAEFHLHVAHGHGH